MEYFQNIFFITIVITFAMIVTAMVPFRRTCTPTTPDELGPYYYPDPPHRRQICERDRAFHTESHLLVTGRVLNEACQGIEGARVEVWQADHDGHYLFRENCRGYFNSNKGGHYAFLTMHPGKYSTDPERELFRPAHIHYRVAAPGYNILVTQMYFYGDSSLGRNDSCSDCSSRSPDLVVKTREMCADQSGKFCFNVVHFDIVLRHGNDVDVVKDREDSLPELIDAAEVGK